MGRKRALLTTTIHGRTAVVSSVLVMVNGTRNDPYSGADGLNRLEKANCGCGVTDLVTAGVRVPDQRFRHRPAGEVFDVGSQDQGVWVTDAAWLHGPTRPHDRVLRRLAHAVEFSNVWRLH